MMSPRTLKINGENPYLEGGKTLSYKEKWIFGSQALILHIRN